MTEFNFDLSKIKSFVEEKMSHVSSETLGWLAIVLLHAATIPSLIAVMGGLTDRMPPLDMVLLVWTGLTLLFVRAAVLKDMLNLITIGFGFILQAALTALIFFK
jgi:hypothetical protein